MSKENEIQMFGDQYDKWLDSNPIEDDILSEEELRNRVIKDLTDVSCMPVEEYTLYQKYLEIHQRYPSEKVSTLFGDELQIKDKEHEQLIRECENNIWFPKNEQDFENLDIEMVYNVGGGKADSSTDIIKRASS